MATLNQVQLIGYVGDEPKNIATKSGKPMSTIVIATTDREIKRADGTIIPERTEWHNIAAFGKIAEIIQRYVHKGALLYVSGSLHSRTFDKNDGSKGYTTEIVCETLQLLDRKPNNVQTAPVASTSTMTVPKPDDDLPF